MMIRLLSAAKVLPVSAHAVANALLVCVILTVVTPGARGEAAPQDNGQNRRAQTRVAFEVASIRPNKSGAAMITINTLPGGRFVATNVSARSLIRIAYGLEDHQLVGGPAWIDSESFDVQALAGRELPEMNGPFGAGGALPDMLKSLLAERFRLTARVELRDSPVFHLVMMRDGQPGEDLKRSAIDCAALMAQRKPGDGVPPCGVRIAPGSIVLEGAPVSQLASALTGFIRRAVIDHTNLEGTYDLQLHWEMRPSPVADVPPTDAPPQRRTLVHALEDSAGMRLVNAQEPQQVLIIDSIQQPSPN